MSLTKMYICDPLKNENCPKVMCYLSCTQPTEEECKYTSNIDYAKYPQTENTKFIFDGDYDTLWELEGSTPKDYDKTLMDISDAICKLKERMTRMELNVHRIYKNYTTDLPVYLEDKNAIY